MVTTPIKQKFISRKYEDEEVDTNSFEPFALL
jgi:hypothetical protein